jgi:type VI secretion system protein ImpB
MADSVQHKIARNRPPRVQITYDVEIGDAIEKAEIPFVVGIMADLSGLGDNPRPDKVPLKDKDRPFVEIDRDNFGDVMAKIAPRLPVEGALDHDGKSAADGSLVFKSLDDFGPDALVARIDELRKWQTERAALRDILTKLDSNDAFYDQVLKWVNENEKEKFADLSKAASERLAPLRAANGAPAA